ncbi:hypothetical protein EBB79_12920 [Parasedimentitalea marina]|uniref:LysR substrate-binding domain-containing protein n=1 Tax=Parasedimentitalea marina TaxID=2483033 RepID=A0A3T0N3T2_9RHOB|nr:hypothetical protein [Parasedimentitalea marina]AZV78688.1 hypothetical protein EBB79_12920 [Parasedimentitalea marina]
MIALLAAHDDMGAVLGWEGLTKSFVDAGWLVKLQPETVASPVGYYVKLPPHASDRERLVLTGWPAINPLILSNKKNQVEQSD